MKSMRRALAKRRAVAKDVDVFALENLADVGTRDVHLASKGRFVHAEFFHPREDRADEEGADSVNTVHGVYELKLRVEVEERMFPYFFISDAIIAPTSLARSSMSCECSMNPRRSATSSCVIVS